MQPGRRGGLVHPDGARTAGLGRGGPRTGNARGPGPSRRRPVPGRAASGRSRRQRAGRAMIALPSRRRLLVPEVIQTSAMDCGPAVLQCLLEGFGIPVHYGRLREACQTDVDGTSLNVLEEVGNQFGLAAEQVMLPANHLLLAEAEALPAILVVQLPSGFTHFVLVWRRHGPFVQVMDPSVGRRWLLGNRFLEEVYIHGQRLPARAWH